MARRLTDGTRRCVLCDKYADWRVQHGEYYCEPHYLLEVTHTARTLEEAEQLSTEAGGYYEVEGEGG